MTTELSREELQHRVKELESQLVETRQTADDAKESAAYLKAIIDNTNLPIYLKREDHSYILVNKQYEKLANIDGKMIVGKSDFDIFPKPVAELFRAQDEEVKEKGELVEFTETIPLADAIHTFITAKFPLKNDKGEIYAIGGFCTDITAIQQTEEALRLSKIKSKSIIESCPLGILAYELEAGDRLVLKDANPAASTILGVDCEQLIGKTIEEAFPAMTDTEIPEKLRLAGREGLPWQSELFDYKDNQIEGAFKVNAFQTEPGSVSVMFEDITNNRLIEQELQKIHKLESIGTLAGGIAHDFNNLLTVIIGNISLVKSIAKDNNNILEKLTNVEKASYRAQDLTQQLLTFSRGGAPIKEARYINELIQDSTTFTLSGSNVKSELFIPDDLKSVMVDEGQLSQVIQNLVKNADQAMPDGGVITIRASNTILGKNNKLPLENGEYLRVIVEDHGSGIPKKNLAKIFDPYFSTKSDGNGLGLAVAYSIVNNHDGLLTAESEEGLGSKFYLYLPTTASLPLADCQPEPSKQTACAGKILIMDDEETILAVASDILQHIGYDIETSTNGNEAITLYKNAMAKARPFDAVILDLTIPGGMGGEETIKHLREIDPDIKAMVSSGYANDRIMSDYESFGFCGVVSKPYNIEEMRNALHTLLD
jgi:PAS domain S-box-containing protein